MASRLQLCEHCNFFIRAEPICPFCQMPTALYQPPGLTARVRAWWEGRELLRPKTPEQLESERQRAKQRAREASTRATYGGPSYNLIAIKEAQCIQCGECVVSCPNQVFTMHPQTRAVGLHPERCRSSARCSASCPTQAITLYDRARGSRRESAARVSASYETTAPGVYLIEAPTDFTLPEDALRAAQAVIAQLSPRAARPGEYDVIVLGASLGGLVAGLAARERGLRCLILDTHEGLSGAALVTRGAYPKFFQEPLALPLGASLHPHGEDTAAQLQATFERLITAHGLQIEWEQQVSSVRKLSREELETRGANPYRDDQHHEPRLFEIETQQGRRSYAANVIFGASPPRVHQPECPGVDARHPTTGAPLVRYERPATLTPYQRKRCLVTGGSEKAARLALELAASGAKVVMVYGKERLSLLQPETERALWRAIREKQLTLYLSAALLEITPRDTRLQHQRGAAKAVAAGELRSTGAPGEERLEVEAIFALLGAPAPERLLRSLGVEYT